jgi:serine O-acetyltransferase
MCIRKFVLSPPPPLPRHQKETIEFVFDSVINRLEFLISKIKNKYFRKGNDLCFDHLHSDQYAIFLYFLSNSLYREYGDCVCAKKVYFLNKTLHSLDIFYAVNLPDIFFLSHPVGSVLGRAEYSNYLSIRQNCTIGGNPKLVYPRISQGLCMYAGAMLIGDSKVEKNCTISASSIVDNENLPTNSIYKMGQIKTNKRNNIEDLFYT